MASKCERNVGGKRIDEALTTYCLEEFKREEDLSENEEAKRRVRQSCERAKIALSKMIETKVKIHTANNEATVDLTEAKFNELTSDIRPEFGTLLNEVLGTMDS